MNPSYIAYISMIEEASLSPKLGLVDMFDSRTHKDMDWHLLFLSANAIYPYFKKIENMNFIGDIKKDWIDLIEIGKECEKDMRLITNNINTHRGQIFLLGLSIYVDKFVENFEEYVDKMVEMSLYYEENFIPERTHGGDIRRKYGRKGIIYELINGLPSLCSGIETYEKFYKKWGRYASLFLSFIKIVSVNDDTTTIYRGGMDSLLYIQEKANNLILRNDIFSSDWWSSYEDLDKWINKKNLSCGGSADILSLLVYVRYKYFNY